MAISQLRAGVLGLVVMVSMAHSADARLTIQAAGGGSIPVGDFSDLVHAETGFQFGGAVGYRLNDLFAVGVDGSWNRNSHGLEGQTVDLGSGVTRTYNSGDKFSTWQIGGHGTYFLPVGERVRPYLLGGVGVYNTTETLDRTETSGGVDTQVTGERSTDSRLGFKAGLGSMLRANDRVSVGLEGNYNLILQDEVKAGTNTLHYIGVTAAITFDLMK